MALGKHDFCAVVGAPSLVEGPCSLGARQSLASKSALGPGDGWSDASFVSCPLVWSPESGLEVVLSKNKALSQTGLRRPDHGTAEVEKGLSTSM